MALVGRTIASVSTSQISLPQSPVDKIEAGTLRASTSKAFVQNGSHTLNGGKLNLNGYTLTMTSLSGSGVIIALGGASLTLTQASDMTFVGGMAGTGVFTKQGQGTLFFTNDNSSLTYTVRIAEGHVGAE